MKQFQPPKMTRKNSDNFYSRFLISIYAICNACQFAKTLNSGIENAKPDMNGLKSKIVFGALENQGFIVKHATEGGKMFFGVNMATAATHTDADEHLINAICDTGRTYNPINKLN